MCATLFSLILPENIGTAVQISYFFTENWYFVMRGLIGQVNMNISVHADPSYCE